VPHTYPPKSFRERRHGAIEQNKKLAFPLAKERKKKEKEVIESSRSDRELHSFKSPKS